MPAYEVRRTRPVLAVLVVEAASEEEAEYFAGKLWVEDAKAAAASADIKRQPSTPDDDGDTRSEARYEQTAWDDDSERIERERRNLA
jgi:hypothetical protein